MHPKKAFMYIHNAFAHINMSKKSFTQIHTLPRTDYTLLRATTWYNSPFTCIDTLLEDYLLFNPTICLQAPLENANASNEPFHVTKTFSHAPMCLLQGAHAFTCLHMLKQFLMQVHTPTKIFLGITCMSRAIQ